MLKATDAQRRPTTTTFESLNPHRVEVAHDVADDDTGPVAEPPGVLSRHDVYSIGSGGLQRYAGDHSHIRRLHEVLLSHTASKQTYNTSPMEPVLFRSRAVCTH